MKKFGRVMGLLFGSARAHTYQNLGKLLPPPPGYNHEIWTVDVDTSFKEGNGLKSGNFYDLLQFLIALPGSIF